MNKQKLQLGMNPSTANSRLRMDLLFAFATATGHKCHRCGKPLLREDFSIEHIKPWLDSDDPVGLYFDIENIAYSHQGCNSAAARRPHKAATEEERYERLQANRKRSKAKNYTTERRHTQYIRTGK